jgi:hypothetical protein
MQQLIPDNLTFTEVGHLPIIKQFAKGGAEPIPAISWFEPGSGSLL